MPTLFTHAVLGASAGVTVAGLPVRRRFWLASAGLSMLPDADMFAVWLGIVPHAHMLGHRGFSHSLLFALLAGAATAWLGFRTKADGSQTSRLELTGLALFFFGVTWSHGWLDAMTSFGGLGIPLFYPLDATRYHLEHRPMLVAPLTLAGMFSLYGWHVLETEFQTVWLPALAAAACSLGLRAAWRRRRPADACPTS